MEGVIAASLRHCTRLANGVLECDAEPARNAILALLAPEKLQGRKRGRWEGNVRGWLPWTEIADRIFRINVHIDCDRVRDLLLQPMQVEVSSDSNEEHDVATVHALQRRIDVLEHEKDSLKKKFKRANDLYWKMKYRYASRSFDFLGDLNFKDAQARYFLPVEV